MPHARYDDARWKDLLLQMMEPELGGEQAAQSVACQCVVHAATKDHANWELLGMPAVLPPPEEVTQVETAMGASRAEQQRNRMR